MAWITKYETNERRRGKPVATYRVTFKDLVRDENGLPIPVDPAKPNGRKKTTNRQETFPTRELAEARRDELNSAKHSGTVSQLADQRVAGTLPMGHYAAEFFKSQQGTVKPGSIKEGEAIYRRYLAEPFGQKATATITAADVRHFRAAMLSPRPARNPDTRSGNPTPKLNADGTPQMVTLSRSTVKKAYDILRRILDLAVIDGALKANPVHSVPLPRHAGTAQIATGDDAKPRDFKALPLTSAQIAAVADYMTTVQLQPVYALAVTFSAYTGLRAGELRGLEIGDVTLPRQKGAMGMVSVSRTKTRQGGEWVTGTPKSVRSTRVVPLDGWLADDLRTYLAGHPRRLDPSAPLFPGRMTRAEAKLAGVQLGDPTPIDDDTPEVAAQRAEIRAAEIAATYKWTEPINTDNVSNRYYAPALAALDLPPARWHDLRHSFAVLSLSAGEHYMQVSKMLGHASFVTTLTVYADYISEAEGGKQAPLTRPLAAPAPNLQLIQKVVAMRGGR
ncbi:hypothetical protein AXK56_15790 [Tsukamurella pulmonis]|uniref:Phage integrase family protein n=1 Tax=Tsukamurella pulmonis TaxID=47312 RepID=A0A1H1G5G6_9ACTN|nr:tyrosine-type recombinase/integrase [Tsukamurella pulmonis]KXO87837.1 hypothetical protein AXK56_15790 [Tsukamurella pulmonis]SDR08319.1 Phage integrase family protein [Tsukamurella pulmonis]SUP17857.1 site-specific tyrosine recombinase XerC [Tsukamurella pulmonis]